MKNTLNSGMLKSKDHVFAFQQDTTVFIFKKNGGIVKFVNTLWQQIST